MDQTLLAGNRDNNGRQVDDEAPAKGLARENTDRSIVGSSLSLSLLLVVSKVEADVLMYEVLMITRSDHNNNTTS